MIVNSKDIESRDFYHDFVCSKKPILIKAAFNSAELTRLINDKKEEITPLYTRGAVPFLYTYFNHATIRDFVFNIPIIKQLLTDNNTQFRKNMRLWAHNQGNVSYFHYDQRSTDLLNICLSGSKKWLFLPPEAPLRCWPFYNIALPFQKKKKKAAISMTMEQGDIIYIPRNWFHQVITLEDYTKNINIIFNDLADKKIEIREKELAAIKHLLIPNYVYGDNIAIVNEAITQVSLPTIFQRLLIELTPVILLIFIGFIFLWLFVI